MISEINSEKSFGVVFSIVFLIIALYPITNSEDIHLWAIIISAVFLLLAFVAPQVLALPNKLWFKFGMLLGSIIAPVVMALVSDFQPPLSIIFSSGMFLFNRSIAAPTLNEWPDSSPI